jgi:hypothetical protein
VGGSTLEITSEPVDPNPGTTVNLTVTVSGVKEGNKYGIAGVELALALTEKPSDDSSISPATATTDDSGTATSKLTLSRQRGRHVVTATGGGLSGQATIDTLLPPNQDPTRARHTGTLDTSLTWQRFNPIPLFLAAVAVLIAGFGWPYLKRWRQPPSGGGGQGRVRRPRGPRPGPKPRTATSFTAGELTPAMAPSLKVGRKRTAKRSAPRVSSGKSSPPAPGRARPGGG